MGKNIIDNIKVERDYNCSPNNYGYARIRGKHIVEASIPFDPSSCFEPPPEDVMKDVVKGKIVGYFYGNILNKLHKIKGKYAREMPYEMMMELDNICQEIYNGTIVDENAEG